MPTEILVKSGTPIVWAHGTDWGTGAHGFGEETYEMDMTGLATTKARQGVKGDFGATRAASYAAKLGIEFGTVAPAAGTTVDVYLSGSHSATAATGNDGGASGADGAYQDGSESEWLTQCIHIGSLTATADAAGTVQIQTIGRFAPPTRYGSPIVRNATGVAFDTDATNIFLACIPIVDEAQTV